MNTLETYAHPHIGDLPVSMIGTVHVLAVLEPVWREKPETATRVRGRIEVVLDYARTLEWRSGENLARWKGHLDNPLPKRSKVRKVVHHSAIDWRTMPEFMAALRGCNGTAAALSDGKASCAVSHYMCVCGSH